VLRPELVVQHWWLWVGQQEHVLNTINKGRLLSNISYYQFTRDLKLLAEIGPEVYAEGPFLMVLNKYFEVKVT
jgi:hypothetical protein